MIASLAFAVAGLAGLALSLHRHARQAALAPRLAAHPALLRGAGALLLLASLLARTHGADWRIGLVEWIGQAGLCAAAVMLLLTYRPHWLAGVALTALVAALVALML